MTSPLSKFDCCLCGVAYFNHESYLAHVWENDKTPHILLPMCYVAGIFEHIVYIALKAVVFVGIFFINLFLLTQYLDKTLLKKPTEVAQRRLLIGTFILCEIPLAVLVDCLGLICPPAAYKIHSIAREKITYFFMNKILGTQNIEREKIPTALGHYWSLAL